MDDLPFHQRGGLRSGHLRAHFSRHARSRRSHQSASFSRTGPGALTISPFLIPDSHSEALFQGLSYSIQIISLFAFRSVNSLSMDDMMHQLLFGGDHQDRD